MTENAGRRWSAYSATVDGPGVSYAIVGLWDRREQAGAIAVGQCERPEEVGARFGSRLARAARRIARAKALKRIATEAVRTASGSRSGRTASRLLDLATTASRTSRVLERTAARDAPQLTPRELEELEPDDESPELLEDLDDSALDEYEMRRALSMEPSAW